MNLRLVGRAPVDRFFDDQLAAMIQSRDDGLIGGVRLSNIRIEHLRRAIEVTEVVCVQNLFNPADLSYLSVLRECAASSPRRSQAGQAFARVRTASALGGLARRIPGFVHELQAVAIEVGDVGGVVAGSEVCSLGGHALVDAAGLHRGRVRDINVFVAVAHDAEV